MKISKKDLKILLILLSVGIVVLAYLYVFSPLQKVNEAIVQDITGLRAQLTELQVLAAKEEFYKTSIMEMEEEAQEIFNQFPADIKTEDCIMYAQQLELDTEADLESLTFTSNVLAYSWGKGAVNENGEITPAATADTTATDTTAEATTDPEATTTEAVAATDTADATVPTAEGENNKELFVTDITLEYRSTYKELKELIKYIHNNDNRRTVQTMNVSYDTETGNLTGSVEMGLFSLTGLNKIYEAPAIPSMTIGTDNIFGTVEVPTITEEKAEEDTKEE